MNKGYQKQDTGYHDKDLFPFITVLLLILKNKNKKKEISNVQQICKHCRGLLSTTSCIYTFLALCFFVDVYFFIALPVGKGCLAYDVHKINFLGNTLCTTYSIHSPKCVYYTNTRTSMSLTRGHITSYRI